MNKLEEKLYEIAANEVANKQMVKGVYAKAYSDSLGDERLSISLYIKYRVNHLLEETMEYEKQQKQKINENESRKRREIERERENKIIELKKEFERKKEIKRKKDEEEPFKYIGVLITGIAVIFIICISALAFCVKFL